MIPESLVEGQASGVLITSLEQGPWDTGTCRCPQAWLEASSIWMLLHPGPQSPNFPPSSTVVASHPGTSPQELTTEGSPSPDHPAMSPQLICLMKSRWGGIIREAAPGLLILSWHNTCGFSDALVQPWCAGWGLWPASACRWVWES